MSELRRIRPLILPKARVRKDPGQPPQPILLKLSQLRLNDDYQRQLSRDSSRLAMTIATDFDWELYHLPVVSPLGIVDDVTGLPLYEVLDGQHTAIGAVSSGYIRELWCWPGRVNETVESRASSFKKLNTQRTSVSPVELFWADVTAKKEEALEVLDACRRTGASIIKRPKPYGDMAVGETICVNPLISLAKQGGRPYVERVLRICMDLRLAPIQLIWINALTELLLKEHSPHYLQGAHATVHEAIEMAVTRLGVEALHQQAKIAHAGNSVQDRQPAYWYLAHYIHKDIMDHATG